MCVFQVGVPTMVVVVIVASSGGGDIVGVVCIGKEV